MTATAKKPTTRPVEKINPPRSPNYPYVALPRALELAQAIFQKVGRHATGKDVLADTWGLASTSGTFRLVLGAVRAFGLLDDVTGREEPLVKLSERALDILTDYSPGDARRQEAISEAALAPKLHAELWGQYGAEMPADSEVRRFLIRGRKFNDRAADRFIQEYKTTLEYAGLLGPGRAEVEPERGTTGNPTTIAAGDFVQWTSQGVDQFPEPRRVARLSDDGSHAFVEGSMTGLPARQLSRVQPPAGGIAGSPVPREMRQDVLTTREGDVILRMPRCLSASTFEDIEDWLIVVMRNAWRSIEEAEGGSPKPPLRVKLDHSQVSKR